MKTKIFSLLLTVALLFSCAIPAYAVEARSSEQIQDIESTVTSSSGGKISINFEITGTDTMDELGADSIYIYESTSSGWDLVKSFDRNDSNMTSKNTVYHAGTKTYYGTTGEEYLITISYFAEDSSGSDYRAESHKITAK